MTFNQNEYHRLFSSGYVDACIYATPKLHKFSSRDSFPELGLIISTGGSFNYKLTFYLCVLICLNS